MRALVLGATGLVGSALVDILLNETRCSVVKSFVRRPSGVVHPKLEEHVVEFDFPLKWAPLLEGDVLFSALGTTKKQALTLEAQWKVDHTYQLDAATAAAKNGVGCYVLVSAAMADAKSRFPYVQMKGVLEEDVKKLGFRHTVILRPGLLRGERARDPRPIERVAGQVFQVLSSLPGLQRFKPIAGAEVARAMWYAALAGGSGVAVVEAPQVHSLAGPIMRI